MSDVKDLTTVIAEYGLTANKAKIIMENFVDVFTLADRWETAALGIVVTDESQTHIMAAARTLRLEIRERRIAVEKTRKHLKEDAVREGKAIDGLANVVKALMVPLETYLSEQEDYAELREAEREAARKAEAERLLVEKEEREAQEAAAAETARRAEIQAENARLKQEAAEREKHAAAERAQAEKARVAEQEKHDLAMREERARRNRERGVAERDAIETRLKHDQEVAKAKHAAAEPALVECPNCSFSFTPSAIK